ncbi:MAG: hypothetical protein SFX73_31775 [Kofleriaceae bacterium]|nr:hypothetical protein [Kofleriaceae bacterium]
MRFPSSLVLLVLATAGCGDDDGGGGSDAPDEVGPRVIAGGGIGDGPIDGVAYIHVIDDATRMPVSGAAVRVGTLDGTTDATGLFTAEGVTGPQTVTVTAANYRAEMWVGANGTNMTFNLAPAAKPSARSARISGSLDLSSFTVATGHTKYAVVSYSQSDDLGDPNNSITTPENANACATGLSTTEPNNGPCNYSIEVRAGKVALLAPVIDVDMKGTPFNPNDDTRTLIGYAYKTGLTVAENVDQTGVTLSALDIGKQQDVTVQFGSPPSGHNTVAGIIGIDLGDDGIFQVTIRTPTMATELIPKADAFPGGSYQLVGVANTGDSATASRSIVLRRGLSGTTLAAGDWLSPPGSPTVTRTSASWTAAAGATVHSVEYVQGNAQLLNITVLDGSTQVTIPDLVSIPSGAVEATVSAIGAPDLDVNNFALDEDEDKLVQVAAQPVLLQ